MTAGPSASDPHAGAPVLHAGAPVADARLAVVVVHGRGGSAEDLLALAPHLGADDVAYVAPQAAGHAWYPQSFLAPFAANQPHLDSAHRRLAAVLADLERAGLDPAACALLGFSQGACLAVDHAYRFPRRYAFVAALTGGLIGPPDADFAPRGALDGTPVFLGASTPDAHVPWERVERTAAVLEAMDARVTLTPYPDAPHAITTDQVRRVAGLVAAARGDGPHA